jgi:hypothetical protein
MPRGRAATASLFFGDALTATVTVYTAGVEATRANPLEFRTKVATITRIFGQRITLFGAELFLAYADTEVGHAIFVAVAAIAKLAEATAVDTLFALGAGSTASTVGLLQNTAAVTADHTFATLGITGANTRDALAVEAALFVGAGVVAHIGDGAFVLDALVTSGFAVTILLAGVGVHWFAGTNPSLTDQTTGALAVVEAALSLLALSCRGDALFVAGAVFIAGAACLFADASLALVAVGALAVGSTIFALLVLADLAYGAVLIDLACGRLGVFHTETRTTKILTLVACRAGIGLFGATKIKADLLLRVAGEPKLAGLLIATGGVLPPPPRNKD